MLPLLGAVAGAIGRIAASSAVRSVAGGAARAASSGTGSRVLQGMQFGSHFSQGAHDANRGQSEPSDPTRS
jgi:hypothetical protein